MNGRSGKSRVRRRRVWLAVAVVFLLLAFAPFIISSYVKLRADGGIVTPEEACAMGADCILVLGAGVWGEGENAYPSPMLADRLETALALYELGASEKLLMSGDHGQSNYDEVNVMKDFALARGVSSEDVFMDHAGFSTYESMYRARDVFLARKIIIVSQGYHLYRAVYIARALGLNACGVSADLQPYAREQYYEMREVLARCKDFFMVIFQPKPTYLGEAIPVSGDGSLTAG